MTKRKIAIVIQRYGAEVNGGAEMLARWLAERLLHLADVHVLTTCAIDYRTWEDAYPPGESELNGVRLHRFPVDAVRDWRRAQRQTGRLLQQPHSLFDEIAWVKEQGPYSTPLLDAIRSAHARYDAFIFVTYLYAPTFFGLPLVSDKAILVPNAHDEPFLYLPAFRPLFHLPRAIIYNTEPERLLVSRVMGNDAVPQIEAGVGINVPDQLSAARFRAQYGLADDFLLYVGRVDQAKNVPELLDYFLRFRAAQGADAPPLKLVFIGRAHLDLPDHPDIIPLGFLESEADKFDAIQAASVLVMPSIYESLSLVSMEAWLMETPVLVNGRSAVLKHQCRQSNGGLYYHSYDEFAGALRILLADPELRARLGRQGRRFVNQRYNWEVVLAKYQAVFETLFPMPARPARD